MAEGLTSAVENLAEQTKKYDIARYYLNGDAEKAKQMVAGNLRDIIVIKGKFNSSSVYGAYILFFNRLLFKLMHVYGVVSHSFSIDELKTKVSWIDYEDSIIRIKEEGEHDDVLVAHLREEFMNGFTYQVGTELQKLFEQGDTIGINHMIQRMAQEKLGFQNLKNVIDYEQISSLDMELNSKTSPKVDPEELSGEKQRKEEEKKEIGKIKKLEDEEREDPLSGKEVKLILSGSLILAPIKGKEISELERGNRIKIKIIDSNPKAVSVAKAFNAYEDGEIKPVRGRIVSISYSAGAGYVIYAIVAKGIFVKIEEEEETIKVAIDDVAAVPDSSSKPAISSTLLILLVLIFLGLLALVVSFII